MKLLTKDGRTDDGVTPDHEYPVSSPGSGELKIVDWDVKHQTNQYYCISTNQYYCIYRYYWELALYFLVCSGVNIFDYELFHL